MRRQLIALGMLCGLLPGFVVHTHAAEAPAVSAASAVLMDAETGRVLYAHKMCIRDSSYPGHQLARL